MATPIRILGPNGKPYLGRTSPRRMLARYDAAETNDDNRRHWAGADALSAKSAMLPEVRAKLRNRARYETANNCYAKGITLQVANSVIGTGPRLQVLTDDRELNNLVEDAWCLWATACNLAAKLRTMRMSRITDGEAFALFVSNNRLDSEVRFDLQLIEADQVSDPLLSINDPNSVDGIVIDEIGNPVEYRVLPYHPGDALNFNFATNYRTIPAADVIHWFRADRAGQYRGVPEITPALPLFAYLRRYTLATVSAAEIAAEFAVMLKSNLPPDEADERLFAFDTQEIERGMLTTLPDGYEATQLDPLQPTTNYPAFKHEILNEAAKCVLIPSNVALGDSSNSNYASGRLDNQWFHRAIAIDQADCITVVLGRIFAGWFAEWSRVYRLARSDAAKILASKQQWYWDGQEHVDPLKEANAQGVRLANGTTTLAIENAAQGQDWEQVQDQWLLEIGRAAEGLKKIGLALNISTAYGKVIPDPTPLSENADGTPVDPNAYAQGGSSMPNKIAAAAKPTPSAFKLEATAVSFDIEAKAADGTPKRPTFSITGYTGAVMSIGGFYSPVVVDLAGLKAAGDKIPIFLDHDPSRIIGQTDSVSIDASGARMTGTITGDDADAMKVTGHAKNGFEWKASIGASIVRQEFLKAGEKAVVNGRDVVGPLLIAREARLQETSFVAIGADNQTTANVAATLSPTPASPKGASTMFEKWLEAKGFDPAAIDDTQKSSLKAMYDAEQAKATPPPRPAVTETLDQILKAQADDEARVDEITRLAAEASRQRPALRDEFGRLAKSAIEAKSTVQEFELALLRLRANAPNMGSRGRESGIRATAKTIEAALCRAARMDNIEKHFDQRTLEASEDNFRNGLGLQEVLMLVARENGYTGHSSRDLGPLLRAAFPAQIQAGGGFSTISLPGILSNVMNKFLVDYFNAVESGWRAISEIRPVNDFKTNTSYSLTGDLQYDKLGPAGEIKHGTLGEVSYTSKAETYARMLAITRTDLINDDLGALNKVPMRLGRGAALKMNDVIWTAFLAGVGSFWAAGNANLITGGTSALTAAGLTLALQKYRKQTDPDGKPMGLTPTVLLVPPELEIAAYQLVNSTAFNSGGASTTDQIPNSNPFFGKYKVVVASYLSNSSYTGYSTTAWFLLSNPMDVPTIEVPVLNGREMPTIESAEADFNTLGIQVRGFHDFGASLQEARGSVRSAGV